MCVRHAYAPNVIVRDMAHSAHTKSALHNRSTLGGRVRVSLCPCVIHRGLRSKTVPRARRLSPLKSTTRMTSSASHVRVKSARALAASATAATASCAASA
jgi:hypothetical protein